MEPSHSRNSERLFQGHFFRHAELALPALIEYFQRWQPDLILSHFRDFAGSTAAEYLGIPFATFGSHQSPWRIEQLDPPFGAGLDRAAPKRTLEIAWRFHHEFNNRVDTVFNSSVRRPLGLGDIKNSSTLHSNSMTLLSLPSFLSNKNSPEPAHIHFVGPQFTHRFCTPGCQERLQLSRIAHATKECPCFRARERLDSFS